MNLSHKKLKKGSFKLLNVKPKDVRDGGNLPETIVLHTKKELDNGVYLFKYKGVKIRGIIEKSLDTVYKVSAFSKYTKSVDVKLSEAEA
jgi:hypothetical protein